MQNAIKQRIKFLCARAIDRARARDKKVAEYAAKYTKRTGLPTTASVTPITLVHKHFDPYYCKRNANFLAKCIWHKILDGTYQPMPAVKYDLPKPGGGKRQVMQFSFPDAAVASALNIKLTTRNLKKQSGNSFAYRPDRNVFDALLKLRSAIKTDKTFILQLDFEKYFDNIPHTYLKKILNAREYILVSDTERKIISAFLCHRFSDKKNYQIGNFEHRTIGTPQGSSISLTLANLASHPLDLELEAVNGQFARYADDTVVVSYSYEDAIKAYDIFRAHCKESGLRINRDKSPGIWILSEGEEEFRSLRDFKFLGYGVSSHGLIMHDAVERRLKFKLSRLINLYLIHYIKKTPPMSISKRVGVGYDWDLLGLIYEIRLALYGGLTEEQLRAFVKLGKKLPRMRGLMGFYALLDSSEALVRLNGWLASTIKQALHRRYKLLGLTMTTSKKSILNGSWYDSAKFDTPTFRPDPKLPSLVRAWSAARKYYFCYGLHDVEPPRYLSYY